jgi:predicted alpha/beta-hydrolase family hydrolase
MFDLNVKHAESNLHVVLAHGAGAGLRHDFMQGMQEFLCEKGVNVWTFNFGYMQKAYAEEKKIPPSRLPILIEEYAHVITEIRQREPNAQLWIGGKSMGGRVACHVACQSDDIKGVAVLGYPFHPFGKPNNTRLDVLHQIEQPVIIIQGERDTFGNAQEIADYSLPTNIAVHCVPDGDHSLKPRKVSGLSQIEHMHTAASKITQFIKGRASE